ncbi:MAG TPA: MFS transporter [Anaerolineaceae bacterium]
MTQSVEPANRARIASISERLDNLPRTRFHTRLLLVSGFGWMFDAMDILMISSIVAAVAGQWHLAPVTSQWVSSINIAGLFIGALVSGSLADRFGRKTLFLATLLIYSVFTGLAALSPSVTLLMIFRFIAGLGLGGELPIASTMVSELAPARYRGSFVVLLESFWAYGSILAALIGYLVVPTLGWRIAFLFGGLPAFYVFVLRRGLPESPRFLASQGKFDEAEAVVSEMERYAGGARYEPAAPQAAVPVTSKTTAAGSIFTTGYLKRTVVLWVMWAAMNFSYYGIFLWLPTQFVRKGFSLQQALLFNLIIAVAQIPGYFSAAYLVEKIGRKATFVSYLLCAAIGSYFFGQVALAAKDIPEILVWGSIISFFNLGAWGVVYTYTPELYPTRLRGSGSGWAAAVGRLFAFLAPLSIAVQIALFGSDATVFLAFTGVMILGGLIVLLFGPETRGRSLEALESAT